MVQAAAWRARCSVNAALIHSHHSVVGAAPCLVFGSKQIMRLIAYFRCGAYA